MALTMSRIDRVRREYDVTATLPSGAATTVATVGVALLPPRTRPTGATTWTDVTVTSGVAPVLYAGPDASPTGALIVPAGDADAWMRAVDGPEVITSRIERITVQ